MLFSWLSDSPGRAIAYLLLTSVVGVLLMKAARAGFGAIMRGFSRNASPWSFILLGKMWFAGALLLFPGYLTDIIALLIIIAGMFVAAPSKDNGGGAVVRARVISEDNDDRRD